MSGSLWSVLVAQESRRQDDSHQLSMMQNFRTATDEQMWLPWNRRAGVPVASVVDGAPALCGPRAVWCIHKISYSNISAWTLSCTSPQRIWRSSVWWLPACWIRSRTAKTDDDQPDWAHAAVQALGGTHRTGDPICLLTHNTAAHSKVTETSTKGYYGHGMECTQQL